MVKYNKAVNYFKIIIIPLKTNILYTILCSVYPIIFATYLVKN